MSSMFPAPMMAGRYHVTTMVPGVDGTGITTAEKAQLVNDVAGMRANVDVMSALRFDPAHPNYGAVRGPVSAAQRTANTAAINLAASDALAAGGTLVIKGDYETDDTVQCETYMDGASGKLTVFNQSGVGLQLGPPTNGRMYDKLMYLPAVVSGIKSSGGGWPGTDIGVRFSNAYHCEIHAQEIANFRRGLVEHADGPRGNVYNNLFLGILSNNFINFDVEATNGGWVNQNVHIGGRFYHHSSEGEWIPGARHARIERVEHSSDNLTFIGTSWEAQGAEYAVEHGGRYNTFLNCRWEIRGTYGPRILALDGSRNLIVDGGYFVDNVQIVGPSPNSIIRGAMDRRTVSGFTETYVVSNTSGIAAAFTIMAGGTDTQMWTRNPATEYTWQFSAHRLRGKSTADAFPRWEMASTGAMFWGDGTAEPTTTLIRNSSGSLQTSNFDTNVLKIGANYYWTDSAGMLRKHTTKPPSSTSTSVGTVIG